MITRKDIYIYIYRWRCPVHCKQRCNPGNNEDIDGSHCVGEHASITPGSNPRLVCTVILSSSSLPTELDKSLWLRNPNLRQTVLQMYLSTSTSHAQGPHMEPLSQRSIIHSCMDCTLMKYHTGVCHIPTIWINASTHVCWQQCWLNTYWRFIFS